MASAVLLGCIVAALMAVPGTAKPQMVTLVGAGDIADSTLNEKATRRASTLIRSAPDRV